MAGARYRAGAGRRGSRLSGAQLADAEDRERAVDILADRAAGLLTIEWGDGHRSAYDFEWLRWNCPCAECAGEAGLPGRLATVDHLRQDQYTLVSVEAVGLFGIRPTWRDGHDTGIFGLALLRSICPCAECAERAAKGPLGHQAQNLMP